MSRFGALEIGIGEARLRLSDFDADFQDPSGGEVVVDYAGGAATVHVLGCREITDGGLTCSVDGGRRAMVTMDLGFLRRIVAEAPTAAADGDLAALSPEALRAALAAARDAIEAYREAGGGDSSPECRALWSLLPAASKEGQAQARRAGGPVSRRGIGGGDPS